MSVDAIVPSKGTCFYIWITLQWHPSGRHIWYTYTYVVDEANSGGRLQHSAHVRVVEGTDDGLDPTNVVHIHSELVKKTLKRIYTK